MQTDDGWLARDPVSRQAQLRPGRLAVREMDTGRAVTFAQLEDAVRRCDAALRTRLSEPGARVALLARNSLAHAVLLYGCPRAGAAFVPLNWRLPGPELAGLLSDAAPEMLIYEDEFAEAAEAALASAPVRHAVRLAPGEDPLAQALCAESPAAPQPISPHAPSMLLYTSGTTGRPKGVVVTTRSALHSALNFAFVGELTSAAVQLCDVPLFHVVGLQAILHASMLAGATVLLSRQFTPGVTLARLADRALGVSHYFCVPQMARALVSEPGFEDADLDGLRVFTGGAPMPTELVTALAASGALPSNGFGMSEAGTIMHVPTDREVALRKPGSVGVPAPAIEVRLVGTDGRDVAPGATGEIWLRGPSISPGYWNQPEATEKAFVDGWLRTGDAGRQDEDGFYAIVDRWKDMYISGGENVYPAEVEAALEAMPQVAEAAVVGVPDARWGEVGCAFLVLREGVDCQPAEVAAWCVARIARYKHPAYVRVVAALPRTGSGKVKKDVLRAAFAEAPASA